MRPRLRPDPPSLTNGRDIYREPDTIVERRQVRVYIAWTILDAVVTRLEEWRDSLPSIVRWDTVTVREPPGQPPREASRAGHPVSTPAEGKNSHGR